MDSYRVIFDSLDWHSPMPGARFKVFRHGTKQVRLAEFTPEFVEPDWCEKGHAGFIVSGELEIDFRGRVVRFAEGSALLIPPGPENRHKARTLTPRAQLFLVEDI